MKALVKTLGFIVIAGLGVVFYLHGCPQGNKGKTQATDKPVSVEVKPVKRATIEEVINAKGTLFAVEQATISPKIPGKIALIKVEEGLQVKAGQVVAELDKTQLVFASKRAQQGLLQAKAALAQSKAAIAQAEANFQNVKSDYQRMKRLHDKKSIAEQKYDHALTGLRVAEALLRQASEQKVLAEAQVSQANIGIGLALTQLEDTKVTSPIEGTITRRAMNLGEMARPGKPIFIVEQLSVLELKANVSSLFLGRLKLGNEVRVSVDGFKEPIIAGIDEISPRVDRKLRTVEITVRIDNRNSKLRPGLFARLEIILEKHSKVVVVPKTVLVKRDSKFYVYRLAGVVAKKVPVTVGLRQEALVEITDGLDEGDLIVTVGQNNLQGGEKVNVQGAGK